jgi:hypothetical protein
MTRLASIFGLVVALCGCATPDNLWRELERAAQPTSEGLQQTQFALIGELEAPEGTFYVAVQKLVGTGMLAPRGQAKLLLFDSKRQLVSSYGLINAYPLWCEGSRVYLWGDGLAWNIPVSPRITELWPESAEGGNVIDFSLGLDQPYITKEMRYGSSGGIEDDPWRVDRR